MRQIRWGNWLWASLTDSDDMKRNFRYYADAFMFGNGCCYVYDHEGD